MSEDSKEKLYARSSATTDCYGVEIRYTGPEKAKSIGKLILTKEWTRLPMETDLALPDPRNVPSGMYGVAGCVATDNGFCGYESAHAVARVFLAQLSGEFGLGHLCVEVRIIKARIQYSYSIVESGVGEIINRTDGPREKFVPRNEVGDLPLSAREIKPDQNAGEQ